MARRPVGRPPRSALPPGGADRRQQIVEAATKVLGERGYTKTRLSDIARAADVTPALIHHYFGSKENLLLAVMAVVQDQLYTTSQGAADEIADPIDRIAVGVDRFVAELTARPGIFRIMLDLYALGLGQPSVRKRGVKMLELAVDREAAEIERFFSAVGTAPPIPARDLAGAIVAAFDGVAISAMVRGVEPVRLYRGLKLLLMSGAMLPYALATQQFPADRLTELLG